MFPKMKFSKGLAAAVPAFGLLVAVATTPANASASLTITDSNLNGGAPFTITDTMGIGIDSEGIFVTSPGFIQFTGNDFSVSVGKSKPVSGSANSPNMDLDGNFTGKGTLTLSFTDSGFNGGKPITFLTSVGGTLGATGDTASFASSSTVGSLANLGPFSAPPLDFSGHAIDGQDLTATYGLDLVADILNGSPTGETTFDMNLTVPEPATLALFGAGLLGCALFLGRRRSPNA